MSKKIVVTVQSLALSVGWELTHVRDFNAPRTSDETWVPRFVAEGGKGILSADRKMLARPHQMIAIAQGGLIGLFLPAQWAQARRHAQAAHLLWWWPKIEAAIVASQAGQCWRIPYDFAESAILEEITPAYGKIALAGKYPPPT